MGLAPKMATEREAAYVEALGQLFQEHTCTGQSPSSFFCLSFFTFLQNHVSQPNRTLQAFPQALWLSGEAPMNEWLPTPEELSAPLHRASVRKGVQLEALSCPPPSAAGREGRPGSPVFLEPVREGGRRGSKGRRKGRGPGRGRPGGRPTIAHQECAMLSNQCGDTNDDCQNDDSDRHTNGDQDFLLWESSGKQTQKGREGNQGLRLEGRGGVSRLTFRAFFWFSRAILTCSCPRST